jgi:hypothetical protein
MVHFYESGITNNTATGPMGGGVYNNGPVPGAGLLLRNTTVSGNTSSTGGAGIYNTSNFDFEFVTIADNNPDGLRIDTGFEIRMRDTILSNNTGGNCTGINPDSVRFNISSDASCGFTAPEDLSSTDPLLEPLGFHGSTAPSHPLGVGSPAINSGTPDLCTANDQNYTSRPQGPRCDRGAFEAEYLLGILRGWTYIDSNRNDQRDPTDGAISGAFMELKEGPCPGGAIIATATSSSPAGFYEIVDIPPGDYCMDHSPIQQTLYPEFIDVSIGPGDVLEEVNFRYLLSPLGDSSISGKVWHDECAVPYGNPTSTPPGCIAFLGGGYGADGIYDPSEPGIEGVKLFLYSGFAGCPGNTMAPAGVVYTDANGDYTIPGLTEGTWCVVADQSLIPNDTILIPGNWTYPVRNAAPAWTEVVVGPAEDAVDVNFGWDYQYLPEPLIPYSYLCEINLDAFMRRGPGTDFMETAVVPAGAQFEALARSEKLEPLWLFGKSEGRYGYMSASVMECLNLEVDKLEVRLDPVMLPEVEEEPEPPVCKPELPESKCIRAGGTYIPINDKLSICYCP